MKNVIIAGILILLSLSILFFLGDTADLSLMIAFPIIWLATLSNRYSKIVYTVIMMVAIGAIIVNMFVKQQMAYVAYEGVTFIINILLLIGYLNEKKKQKD